MADQQNIKTVITAQVDTSQVETGVRNLRKEYSAAYSDLQ